MKKWQKTWLWLVIIYSIIHIIRDVCQDLGIKNLLSTVLIKTRPSKIPEYWNVLNTYSIALFEIVLATLCLKRKKFGKLGYITIFVAIFVFFAWSYYWFFL